ncbi:hypothetical protein Tco_0842180 [Tanacetum coccineum]|uniref:Uncharacterized protein n=1 Tax=Tanacetum coccineum TaxID=301880 RepID=A0ABQ5AZT5_9ASTR
MSLLGGDENLFRTSNPPSQKHFQTLIMPGCLDTRKKALLEDTVLGDKLVTGCQKKPNYCTGQCLIAGKSMMALSASCAQVMWMRTLTSRINGFKLQQKPLYCDSSQP